MRLSLYLSLCFTVSLLLTLQSSLSLTLSCLSLSLVSHSLSLALSLSLTISVSHYLVLCHGILVWKIKSKKTNLTHRSSKAHFSFAGAELHVHLGGAVELVPHHRQSRILGPKIAHCIVFWEASCRESVFWLVTIPQVNINGRTIHWKELSMIIIVSRQKCSSKI